MGYGWKKNTKKRMTEEKILGIPRILQKINFAPYKIIVIYIVENIKKLI